MLIQRLEDRGLYLHYTKRSWSAWDALRLEGVALHRTAKRDQPVVEMSALTVDFALLESATNRAVVSRWRSDDATLKLHDDAGIVTFEHVSAAVVVRAGEIEIPQMESRNDGLAFAFSGKLLLAHDSERIPGKADDFTLDLSTVRAVLTVAAFKADGKPFAIQGTYFSDFRDTPVVWQADLAGTGKAVEWQGVPLRDAIVSAQLSNTGMKLTSNLQFARGSAKASVSRSNWKESPLLITGSFADSAGQTNDFSASYESTAKLVQSTVSAGAQTCWSLLATFRCWFRISRLGCKSSHSPTLRCRTSRGRLARLLRLGRSAPSNRAVRATSRSRSQTSRSRWMAWKVRLTLRIRHGRFS